MTARLDQDRALARRLGLAELEADRHTETGIQRCRTWCVVVATVQTALYPGDDRALGWAAVALVALTWAWVRTALRAEAAGRRLPLVGWTVRGADAVDGVGAPPRPGAALAAIGWVATVGDAAATLTFLVNLQRDPYDPVGLLPLVLVAQAATRWGRRGGIIGGLLGGVMSGAWSFQVHRRHDLSIPATFISLRIVLLTLIGALVGHTVSQARQQRRAASAIFNASRDLVATFSLDGSLRAVNPASEAILGYTPDELLGRDRAFLLDLDDRPFGPPDVGLYRRDGAQLVEVRAVHRDGSLVWIELDLLPDLDAGVVHAIGRDVSDRRRTESELRHRVDHDGLTGVWNRDAMLAYLGRMSERGYHPGLVFIDLDQFKAVNDTYGHVTGDRLLVAMAERLSRATGPDGSVARYAGDEFCIVVDDPGDLDDVAARVRRALDEPFAIGGLDLALGASLGLAVCAPGESPEHLVHRADQQMYVGKRDATAD